MAYLTGIEHILYVMKQSDFESSVNGVANSFLQGSEAPGDTLKLGTNNAALVKTLFINPGSKPSVQTSVIEAEGVGFVAGRGRSRSIVTGSFSFYLDTTANLDFFVQNILDAESDVKHKFNVVGKNDESLTIAGVMNGVAYLIEKAYVTGLSIGASDPTSLVSVDVTITAAKQNLKYTSGDLTNFVTPMMAIATPTLPSYVAAKSCQLTNFTYGTADTGITVITQDHYPVPFSGLTVDFQKPMEIPAIMKGTGIITLNSATEYSTEADYTQANIATKRASIIKGDRVPVMTGNKSLTSSFNVPYDKSSTWTSFFNDIINGGSSDTASLTFQLGEGNADSVSSVKLSNVEFNGVDFTDISEDVIEYPVSVTAYESSKALGELRLQGVTA